MRSLMPSGGTTAFATSICQRPHVAFGKQFIRRKATLAFRFRPSRVRDRRSRKGILHRNITYRPSVSYRKKLDRREHNGTESWSGSGCHLRCRRVGGSTGRNVGPDREQGPPQDGARILTWKKAPNSHRSANNKRPQKGPYDSFPLTARACWPLDDANKKTQCRTYKGC